MRAAVRDACQPGGRAARVALVVATVVIQLALLHRLLGEQPFLSRVMPAGSALRSMLLWTADGLVLALPAIMMGRSWRWLQWPVLALFTAWGVAQLMYFPTYRDLMPPSSFMLWQNLDGMVIDSALGNWARRDWLFLVPVAILAALDLLVLRPGESRPKSGSAPRRLAWTLLAMTAMRVTGDAVAYMGFWRQSMTVGEYLTDNYTYVKVSHLAYMMDSGLTAYLAYCLGVELAQHHDLNDEELAHISQFLAGQPQYSDNPYDARRDNLIVIVVESLNSWVVGLRIDGREVTPVLNALCADTASFVGTHMKRQVKNGCSSDGHFMYNTGLLPLELRAVAMVYPSGPYPTLVRAIGNDNTIHICADPPALWNTEATAKTYGYRTYVGAVQLRPLLRPSRWQWDKVILEAATRHIGQLRPPFVAQIVTLGMHEPYNRCDVPEGWISRSGQYTHKVRYYLERTAVFDRELGLFLDRLKQQGIYDNSLIVIVSDHNEFVDDDPDGRPAIDPDGRDCLLLVLNSGRGRHIDKPFGQIDVYPTLLDLCGANGYAWKGLGNSLLRQVGGTVALAQGDTVGDGPLLPRQQWAWGISRLIIEGQWFATHDPGALPARAGQR